MMRIALAAICALVGASSALAEESYPPSPATAITLELQAAVRDGDKEWFVSHLHFPVRYFGKTKHIIRSKDWFLSHYDTVIGPELKASVLAQDPEDVFKNYQGIMVGGGSRNIWLNDFGDPGADIPSRYEIITINNSE